MTETSITNTEMSTSEQASATAVEAILFREAFALMSTYGSEQKALIEGVMASRSGSFSARELHNDFLMIQGEEGAWTEIGHRVPFQLVSAGFQKLGFVTKKSKPGLRSTEVGAFELNERGRSLGVGVAGLLLDISERYPNNSLTDIFGKAYQDENSGNFAAEARVGLLFALVEASGPMSVTEIAKRIFPSQEIEQANLTRLSNAMGQLEKLGVINIDMFARGSTEPRYKIGSVDDPIEFKSQKNGKPTISLMTFIASKDLIEANGSASRSEIIAEVKRRLPKEVLLATKESDMVNSVRKTLEILTRRLGLVSEVEFTNEQRSRVVICDDYREVVRDLKYISEILVNGTEGQLSELVELGKLYMNEILADPNRVNKLLQRGKDRSPGKHSIAPEEAVASISSTINPGDRFRPIGLVDWFESNGKPYSRESISNLTRSHPELFRDHGLDVSINKHGQIIISRPA